MVKNLKIHIADVDTGEILAQTSLDAPSDDYKVLSGLSLRWFESWLRGCQSGRNLNLFFTLRPLQASEQNLFKTDVY